MSKKGKLLFRISKGLNILLVVIVAWGIIKMNFVKEQVLVTEVQNNLVELEGLIAHQMDNNWSEPNLVTIELGDVLNGIWLGKITGEQLGTLSKSDKKTLERLYLKLRQYPYDELYRFADVTDEDKRNFEELREILREVGLGMNITISADMEAFMKQAEELNKKIESPLN
ncbi:hypothetical protein P9E76_12680 [Schinkia azotoformans]|uniref:Uncharacterized protein n=1 Tax=Schinkia azotoformans LMG 9581 TaxID=1131731 RepID=K6BUL6_SCHAZ|nr:hypothetical protein [Schinkia azotoformans]EKN62605.1 hypothetical protein BAZO_20853 [Schinkia azotoformans LMG 9581]MEC1639313.1 hypothetical protein [Schinkia azotoformans]MEC1945900.1 hypothetical protein [Schinkia azotoformans]MED4350758.1 hypothetical protein [Schinkia azotoformans]